MNGLLLANTGAIIDIVALVIIGVSALFGLIRGFGKTFISIFGTMLSLLLAVLLASTVTNFLQDKFGLVSGISDKIGGILNGIFGENIMSVPLKEASEELLSNAGLGSWLIGIILSIKSEASYPPDTTLNSIICPVFAYYCAIIISVVALFIIFKLIFFVLGGIIKKMHKFKPIAVIDRTLGFALGVLNAVVNIEFTILIISVIPVGFMQNLYIDIQTSAVCGFLCRINLLGAIVNSLSGVHVLDFVKNFIK